MSSLENATPSEEFSGVVGQTTPENHCSQQLINKLFFSLYRVSWREQQRQPEQDHYLKDSSIVSVNWATMLCYVVGNLPF